ncbi:MAG: fibronectin type III domain-containing protein [Chloroflexota bacterium]|nr:fibronectin type III domain-containing protein [Chloroflexota bacterium]
MTIKSRNFPKSAMILVVLGITIFAVGMFGATEVAAYPDEGFGDDAWSQMNEQGFGDRQNSWAWGMTWFDGQLYVGTNRAHFCTDVAAIHNVFPNWIDYPPSDPDIECTPLPEDLPLQAEIWRWSPDLTWERVFQSPNDVPIPQRPGSFVARDVGFRGLSVFEEADGTEALYVTGVAPSYIWRDVPTARILRSTDGVNFEQVPADPGTNLGDYPFASMRNPFSHEGRYYIQGGAIQGSGVLLEAEDPAGGNDNFRVVSVPGQVVSSATAFNGYIYMGLRDSAFGYSVVKAEAGGDLPYEWTTIVPEGAFLPTQTNVETLSMEVFGGKLYIGTNGLRIAALGLMGPAEVIRINPDDTWDVVAGNPRLTDEGWKYPISGFDAGFGNFFNGHMWRLEEYGDNLFLGTFDSSTTFKEIPSNEVVLADRMGFDLFRTPNGIDWSPITLTGFDDRFNFGVRSLHGTPNGLFLGTANYYYGLEIYRAYDDHDFLFLPVISNGEAAAVAQEPRQPVADPTPLEAPEMVQTEVFSDHVVVTWEPVEDAVKYHISRNEIIPISLTLSSDVGIVVDASKWTIPELVGTSTGVTFTDDSASSNERYVYFVRAVDGDGVGSLQSLAAPARSLALPATFGHLDGMIADAQERDYLSDEGIIRFDQTQVSAETHYAAGEYQDAVDELQSLRDDLSLDEQDLIISWKAIEVAHFLGRLILRIDLVDAGVLDPSTLN